MREKTSTNKGSALFLILAICGVLAVLTGSVALGAATNLQNVSGESSDDQARYIAQAGVQAALSRLSQVRSWPSASNPKATGDVWSCVDFNYDEDHLGLWSSSDPNLHAAILAYNNTPGAFHRTSHGPDGTEIPEGRVLLISSGIVDSDQRGERQSTTVAALAKPAGVLFEDALQGGSLVSVQNSVVDAVNSSDPGWTPLSYAPYDISANPTRNARVTSNNNITDSIAFDATSLVDGDVYSGPGSSLGAIGYYGASISGVDGILDSPRDLNVVTPPSTAVPLGSALSADFGAGPTELAGGIYHVRGDLNITNGAELTVTSTTTIYVDGSVNISDAQINLNGKPWHVQIYLAGGSGNNINVTNSVVGALISGPNARINMANSHWFGAAVADEIAVEDTAFHYDTAVSNLYLGSTAWTTDIFINPATTKKLTISPPVGGPPSDPLIASSSGTGAGSGPTSSSGPGPSPGPTLTPSGTGTASGPTSTPSGPGPTTAIPDGTVSGPTGTTVPTGPTGGAGPSGSPSPQPTSEPEPGPVGSPPVGLPDAECCLDYSCGPPRCHIF